MSKYDYFEAVKRDAIEAILYSVDCDSDYINRDENEIFDDLFLDDDVTGNASGSYYCNAYTAEESICHNMDLLAEALNDFGGDYDIIRSAEACDVTIRCWVLEMVFMEAIEEAKEALK